MHTRGTKILRDVRYSQENKTKKKKKKDERSDVSWVGTAAALTQPNSPYLDPR